MVKTGEDWRVTFKDSADRFKKSNFIKDADTTVIVMPTGQGYESGNIKDTFKKSTFIVAVNEEQVKEASDDLSFAGIIPDVVLLSHNCKDLFEVINKEFGNCIIKIIPMIFNQTSPEFLGYFWATKDHEELLMMDGFRIMYQTPFYACEVMDKIIARLVEVNGGQVNLNVIREVNRILSDKELMKQVEHVTTSIVLKDGERFTKTLEEVLNSIG